MSDIYAGLCHAVHMKPWQGRISLDRFAEPTAMAEKAVNERFTAALQILMQCIEASHLEIKKIDKLLVDHLIARIDMMIGEQLDAVIHHPDFKALESVWRSLQFLLDRTESNTNTKIELLDIDKESLKQDFEEALDLTHSALYQHIYVQEYDTPGGEPFTAMISDFMFDASPNDVALLESIGEIAALAHCPFIANINPAFFNKHTFSEVMHGDDLAIAMDRPEYIKWNAFREREVARYIGLTFPRFLLRVPYDMRHPVRTFCYEENVQALHANHYLWGAASFAFASNLVRSFKTHGWAVNIRGPESGGRVDHLTLHYYALGDGLQPKIPLEILVPETRELELANLGLIPFSCYKGTDTACFFSANSVQKPASFYDPIFTGNSRINARLPYVFLVSRLAHYLKVIQREHIGSNRNRDEIERELNEWLQGLVTQMNHPGVEIIASHPLREGKVEVKECVDNPGYYKVNLYVVPHFQVEGVDVQLTLTGRLPKRNKT